MLSLDTSSTDSGYAYWENAKLVQYGSINTTAEKDSLIRQENMITELHKCVKKFKPDILIIESPPFMNSPKTLKLLAEIVGSVWGMVISSAEYIEYEPSRWRSLVKAENETIPRKRAECKQWDIDKVKEIFGIDTDNDNIADAILIGYARIQHIAKING